MPIRLKPISRRDFLRRSLIACLGGALAPRLFAATRRTDADSWALLADTHVAADLATVSREVNMAANLRAVVADVLALSRKPAGAFIVGDLAFSKGEAGDYQSALGLVAPLRADGVPLTLALGNHDDRQNFFDAITSSERAATPVQDRQVALIRGERANWLVLDSLEKTLQTPGLLGESQLDWLTKTLDANKRKPAVVLVHHNPGQAGNIAGLKDTEALLGILRPRKQVKAWIFGHTHAWGCRQDESGLHLVNLPPVAYAFKAGNPSGWIHATLTSRAMKLELRCVDQSHPQHGEKVELKWRK
ncbi:MAG: phosphohydrolase [Verrucomicrobia bacterium]|nr:MAG: phosphohydrolase [Verrucomicrobiota bacterium]